MRDVVALLRGASLTVLLAGLLGTAACMGPPDHDTARAELTGDTDETVAVITSSSFSLDASGSQVNQLRDSDTARIEVPFETSHDLRETGRFFIRALPADSSETGTGDPEPLPVTLRVFIDGDLQYDVSADLRERHLQFIFGSAGS